MIIDPDIDNEFKEYWKKLTPQLLAPKNLVMKRINGNIMTGSGLHQCFKVNRLLLFSNSALHILQSYMKIFESEELPEPKSMLEVTILWKFSNGIIHSVHYRLQLRLTI